MRKKKNKARKVVKMKHANYIFLSKFKGETVYSYSFENYEEAERHIIQLLFMEGTTVSRRSRNTLTIKIDEDYSIVVVKESL